MKTSSVLDIVGGIKELSELLECSRVAIYQWQGEVPDSRQFELEVKTGGRLKSDYTLQKEDALNRGNK